ncbi:MAG: DUF2202 domain-containing protein [Ignavibacteria bacterium]|nr:DUF2202 domain-containing protein [Ignavibacteria bacterium]
MLRNRFTEWSFAIIACVAIIVASCSESTTSPTSTEFIITDSGYSSFDTTQLRGRLSGYAIHDLSVVEQRALLFMRGEEKLVHDLYVSFYARYNRLVFSNIAQSELTHTHAVMLLLQRYQIADPAQSNGPGEFVDTTLQQLYLRLFTAGNSDLVSALLVSAEAEEVDLRDLSYWSARVDNQDTLMVFDNLAKGSRNHLRAFVRNLTERGLRYSPRVLDQATYDAIISAPFE